MLLLVLFGTSHYQTRPTCLEKRKQKHTSSFSDQSRQAGRALACRAGNLWRAPTGGAHAGSWLEAPAAHADMAGEACAEVSRSSELRRRSCELRRRAMTVCELEHPGSIHLCIENGVTCARPQCLSSAPRRPDLHTTTSPPTPRRRCTPVRRRRHSMHRPAAQGCTGAH